MTTFAVTGSEKRASRVLEQEGVERDFQTSETFLHLAISSKPSSVAAEVLRVVVVAGSRDLSREMTFG